MTTEERIGHLEAALQQAAATIQNLSNQVAQTQAQQVPVESSEAAFSPLIDTRMLTKPKTFSGRDEDWPSWAVVTRAYCGALDPRLLKEMEHIETRTTMEPNSGMSDP